MKKVEEYIKNIDSYLVEEVLEEFPLVNSTLKEIIRQAQLDAIEETCKFCAENAVTKAEYKLNIKGSRYKKWEEGDNIHLFETTQRYSVDKQSILDCAEILKKQLE